MRFLFSISAFLSKCADLQFIGIYSVIPWARKFLVGRRPCREGESVVSHDADVVLFTAGDNASIAYFVEPHLASLGQKSTHIGAEDLLRLNVAATQWHTLVIVRYLPRRCIKTLRELRAMGKKIVYFMDDDLMDRSALEGLPTAYARRIRAEAADLRHVIEDVCSEFWVSTDFLQKKYGAWSPVLLAPRAARKVVQPVDPVFVCYHGSASHHSDIEWLVPIISAVQSSTNDVHFEVFGNLDVNRLYRDMPRTSVLHPMSWSNYLAYTAASRRDIGLAPLLPNAFNSARGATKFFDFARLGAVGIYSDVAPYRGFIRNGIDGLLLPNDSAIWKAAILELAGDAPRRTRMLEAARTRAEALTWDGLESRNPVGLD